MAQAVAKKAVGALAQHVLNHLVNHASDKVMEAITNSGQSEGHEGRPDFHSVHHASRFGGPGLHGGQQGEGFNESFMAEFHRFAHHGVSNDIGVNPDGTIEAHGGNIDGHNRIIKRLV